jgi:hypothetical protein
MRNKSIVVRKPEGKGSLGGSGVCGWIILKGV